jgi:TPR repeat protein
LSPYADADTSIHIPSREWVDAFLFTPNSTSSFTGLGSDYVTSASPSHSTADSEAVTANAQETSEEGEQGVEGEVDDLSEDSTNCELRAIYLYGLSADQGASDSYLRMGDIHYYGSKRLPSNKKEAANYYQIAANMHHTHALFNLGVMHQAGVFGGVVADVLMSCPVCPELQNYGCATDFLSLEFAWLLIMCLSVARPFTTLHLLALCDLDFLDSLWS